HLIVNGTVSLSSEFVTKLAFVFGGESSNRHQVLDAYKPWLGGALGTALTTSQEKAPAIRRGSMSMGDGYILGLQTLPLSSHTPPALVQSAFVFAVVTSAAKVGEVNANSSPKATIIDTSFVMVHLLLDTTTFMVALNNYSLWGLSC